MNIIVDLFWCFHTNEYEKIVLKGNIATVMSKNVTLPTKISA